jgi:uncharacterized protein YqgC (DUF456 family)
MDVFFIVIGFILLFGGIIGSVFPGIPGPPLSFLGLVTSAATSWLVFSTHFYFTAALIAIFITVLDYYIPIYGTKLLGGTKAGIRGSTIGLVVAVVALPLAGIVIGPFGLLGIILGPFVGAYLGEKIAGISDEKAWRSALGSFLGFLAGTLAKLIYALVIFGYVIVALFKVWMA